MNRIAYVDPGPPYPESNVILEELNRVKHKDTQVDYVSLDRGPEHLSYRYYESLIIPDVLHKLKSLEKENYDAAVIGCFYDPGLREAREILNRMAVTAPGEASFHLATTLGNNFSIIVMQAKGIPRVRENLAHHGFKNKLASIKVLGMGVLDLHKDENYTFDLIQSKCTEAVANDYAEAIVLGCTMQFGFFERLQKSLGVPVIDALVASLKYAELLAELKKRLGWHPTRKFGYEPPPVKEIREWKLAEQYGYKDNW